MLSLICHVFVLRNLPRNPFPRKGVRGIIGSSKRNHPQEETSMNPLEITLLILLVTIIAFVSGKVPFSVISTGIILALILTGIKTPAEAFGGFINTNVVMFVAMFVIGAGLTKTPLIDKAQSLVIRYKDNMRMLIFLSCVAGAFLGAITSATATAAIMIPLLVGIANDIGVSRSKLLYPSMACANIATQMTFLGQGASNMAWNDVMMQAGAPTPLHIWDFTIARIPMLTIAILYMTFVGYKLMPDASCSICLISFVTHDRYSPISFL